MSSFFLGWGRTGTSTLQRALDILEFGPCHHMNRVIRLEDTEDANRLRLASWTRVFEANDIDGAIELLEGFASSVDYPANTFGARWLTPFPSAKLILTVRENAAKWYESASRTILPASEVGDFKPLFDRYDFKFC